ncbi:GNAT family N-acetyltransferase [Deinococcus lacus]|uniref:GNAT family N-acetyltransferase n=1 Tax=Deinococcus lacus TaxID=392561 RepID=A0ABW1YD87_9DEIO
MTLQIREATAADYPAIAAVLTAVNPAQPVTAELLQASADKTRSHPKGLHLAEWVAVKGSEVVGFAGVAQWPGSYHPDRYAVRLDVPPHSERQGIGTRLAGAVQAHLQARGAREVLAGAYEDKPHAVAFLESRGFREDSRTFDNVLRLDKVAPQPVPPLPDGLRLVTLHEFQQENPHALEAFRAAFNEARADEPRPIPAQPYTAEDMATYLEHPTYFPEGILLAVTDAGEVAALTELWRDLGLETRLHNGLTGTARVWRGRGLATALKLAGIAQARERGIREIWTRNDSTNAPMLAVNTRLGFRPEPAFIEMKWGGVEP